MADPTDLVQEELDLLKAKYPNSNLSYVRDDSGKRVVLKLRGDFECFGPFEPGHFDQDAVAHFISDFWKERRRLFDPSPDPPQASIPKFVVSGLSARLAIVTGQQVADVAGKTVAISGAILMARVAARPMKPGALVQWQLDGFDNSLVSAAALGPTIVPPVTDAAVQKASKAVFGRDDVRMASAEFATRSFPGLDGHRSCLRIAYPAQRRLVGKWKRGAIVYWPLEVNASKPLYVEPDGSYDVLDNNTGPYHQQATTLHVRQLPAAAPRGRRAEQQYELVNEQFKGRNGPTIRTGRLSASTHAPDEPAAFVPLVGTGWQDVRSAVSRVNPGVATDAHAFAHEVVGAMLDLRDGNHINDPILPDPINVAIQVFPAAQPGEWRKSGQFVIIANADDSLPRSWMKRWAYCSDNTVIAHEMAHALQYEVCEFDYCLESGALDEGLADLFAVLITGTAAMFDRPWIREDTPYFHAAKALRDASWSVPLRQAHITPNERVERGEYPNHYADFARLAPSNGKALERAAPRNDHGYIHWNCAMVTRAIAMLAQPFGTLLTHPETRLKAYGLGPKAVADLVFCTLQLGFKDKLLTNQDGAETPFAQFRAALLGIATST